MHHSEIKGTVQASVRIFGAQRNLLFEQIELLLSHADDIYRAAGAGCYDAAAELARQVCDALIFVSEDLGWEEAEADAVLELNTPYPVLRRVLKHIQGCNQSQYITELRAEADRLEREDHEVRTVCEDILAELSDPESP